MEENTIIEEGIEETVTEELVNPVEDVLSDLPTIVEESGNGDIDVSQILIGVGIGGLLVCGIKKIYKMIKAKKKKTEVVDSEAVEEPEEIDDEESEDEE